MNSNENVGMLKAFILLERSEAPQVEVAGGFLVSAEHGDSDLAIANTRPIARRRVLATGSDAETLRPGMTAIVNLDALKRSEWPNGTVFHECDALLAIA